MEIINNPASEFFNFASYYDNDFEPEKILTREDFLKIFPKNPIGSEFGVFKGEFSKKILVYVKPQMLVLCDTWWDRYGDFYPDWGESTQYGKLTTKAAYNVMLESIDKYKKYCNVIVGENEKTMLQFPDKYFDWMYLDASHNISNIEKELRISSPKIKTTGYITGNGWADNNNVTNGLYKGIMEFCKKNIWRIMYVDNFGQWCLRNIE